MKLRQLWLWAECLAIFGVVPLLFAYRVLPTPSILLPLLLIAAPAFLWLGRAFGYSRKLFWWGERRREAAYLPHLLGRFVLISLLLTLVALISQPHSLFSFPLTRPWLWLLFSVVYLLFSVYPQELLYRAFFFHRYRPIMPAIHTRAAASAMLFGWMHVAFGNWTAVLLSMGGGWLFATSYRQTASLRLVCLEHGMYGILIFSLGFGRSFLFEPYLLRMLG